MGQILDINARKYYEDDFEKVMRSGLTGKIFSVSNRMIEKSFKSSEHFSKILELGATGHYHTPFVTCSFDEYHVTDLNPINPSKTLTKVDGILTRQLDATNLRDEQSDSYDRLIATCLVLHLGNLEQVLTEWRRVTKTAGFVSIYVHCEPGLLLRFLRTIVQVRKSRKNGGANFYTFVYSEHASHYLHVKHVIRRVFENDNVKHEFFPFKFLTWNFNFWKIYTIKINKTLDSLN
jgi:hypothetical protein